MIHESFVFRLRLSPSFIPFCYSFETRLVIIQWIYDSISYVYCYNCGSETLNRRIRHEPRVRYLYPGRGRVKAKPPVLSAERTFKTEEA